MIRLFFVKLAKVWSLPEVTFRRKASMKTSLEVKTLGEELLQQKWPKHIPIIMFLLVKKHDLLKEQSDCYWFSSYWSHWTWTWT